MMTIMPSATDACPVTIQLISPLSLAKKPGTHSTLTTASTMTPHLSLAGTNFRTPNLTMDSQVHQTPTDRTLTPTLTLTMTLSLTTMTLEMKLILMPMRRLMPPLLLMALASQSTLSMPQFRHSSQLMTPLMAMTPLSMLPPHQTWALE